MNLYSQNSCLGSPHLFPDEMFTVWMIMTDGHWPLHAYEQITPYSVTIIAPLSTYR